MVDDGSTDITPQVASLYKNFRALRQTHQGLSVARNAGIFAGDGEVVAFTDADCRADEDWLYYLVGDLLKGAFVGVGGHNFLPPDDSAVAAAVMVSPGGPAHVMLTDRQAEHIPGCNMAFYKWALVGDRRLRSHFPPRRRRRGCLLALAAARLPHRCSARRASSGITGAPPSPPICASKAATAKRRRCWCGGIRNTSIPLAAACGRGAFTPSSKFGLTIAAAHDLSRAFWHRLLSKHVSLRAGRRADVLHQPGIPCAGQLAVAGALGSFPLSLARWRWPASLLSLGVCVVAGAQADLPRNKRRFWSRPLVALLFFLQPIVRGWARYQGRLNFGPTPQESGRKPGLAFLARPARRRWTRWNTGAIPRLDRIDFVRRILERLDREGWETKPDAGWSDFDVEILGSRWSHLQLATVAEPHAQGKQMIRCRLRTAWSLAAKVALCSMLGFELVVIGFVWHTLWHGFGFWS